jgi:lysyl-tRNA synthetase class 2
MNWTDPDVHAARRGVLAARGRMKAALRAWFEARDFTEVECSQLQESPCAETHLHAFATEYRPAGGEAERLYLHTSPEFAAKKLLAAGENRIFEFARVFRNGEAGPMHAPEFTMLEWYRRGEGIDAVIADTLALVRAGAAAAGAPALRWREGVASLEHETVTAAEAFAVHAGIGVLSFVDAAGGTDRDGFAAAAHGAGVAVRHDDTWSDIFTRVMAERIEPHLGRGRITVFRDYPRPEAALARVSPQDPRVAERFELYAAGVELANGFGELTDEREQRRRFVAAMDEKERLYGERYPVDEVFLDAVGRMGEASGVALGFDRLVMLATGADHIDRVLWTPLR